MAAITATINVYNKLRTLLEEHAPFSGEVRVGNWIDWTQGQSVVKKYALPNKAPADYPEIELEVSDDEDTLATLTPHYGMRNPAVAATAVVWTEQIRQVYVLTITTEQKLVTQQQLLLDEGKTALRKGIPRLGFSYVHSFGPLITQRTMEQANERNERLYRVARITIPVVFQFNGADLLV